jgi:hypothetical protein
MVDGDDEYFNDLNFLFLSNPRNFIQTRQLVVPYFQNYLPQKRLNKELITGFPLDLFESPPNPQFLCQVCQMVVKKPVECSFCGKLHCEMCVKNPETFTSGKFQCQNCGKEGKIVPPSKVLVKMICEMKVRCRFFESGCSGFFKISDCPRHELTCLFRQVRCANHQFCENIGILKDFFESELRSHSSVVRPKSFSCSKECSLMVCFKRMIQENNLQSALEEYFKLLRSVEDSKEIKI